jgi:hypothetical protein
MTGFRVENMTIGSSGPESRALPLPPNGLTLGSPRCGEATMKIPARLREHEPERRSTWSGS